MKRHHSVSIALTMALACLVVAAAPAAGATTYTVQVGDDYFNPAVRAVARGDAVKWRNVGSRTHTVTLKNNFNFFTSKSLGPGQVYTKTFPGAGTYAYLCIIHPGQSGTIKVPIGLTKVSGKIVIKLATASMSGFRHRIERKLGSGAWSLLANTTATTYSFTPPARGTWTFRARLESLSNGSTSGWAKKSIAW
jgi:plastocyanin